MKNKHYLFSYLIFFIISLFCSCSTSGPGSLFRKISPHEKYGQNLTNAGLSETALGRQWFLAAESSLNNPLAVTVPYKESGYFPAEKARAFAVRFDSRQGQKIVVSFKKKPEDFVIYLDLWEEKASNNRKLLAYPDTNESSFNYEIEKTGTYLLRLQPELLKSGEYTLTITSAPTLAFPVKNGKMQSFWGAERDAGVRSHEGVDIFAPLRTPALAATSGTVTRVSLNNLGGKVAFLRPDGKDYNLYYAHLDEQTVAEGATVKTGDTIGLIGTTGNARGGPPHLHFGIYTASGAVDPLPYIDPHVKAPEPIYATTKNLGKYMRSFSEVSLYTGPGTSFSLQSKLHPGSLAEVVAATGSWYKVLLPDGMKGFLRSTSLTPSTAPMRQIKLPHKLSLLDQPHSLALTKRDLSAGETIQVLGSFKTFHYIKVANENGWIPSL